MKKNAKKIKNKIIYEYNTRKFLYLLYALTELARKNITKANHMHNFLSQIYYIKTSKFDPCRVIIRNYTHQKMKIKNFVTYTRCLRDLGYVLTTTVLRFISIYTLLYT